MRGRFTTYLALSVLLAAGALGGCSNDDSTGPRTGTMSVRMTDAPSQYDQVNLVITQVSVHRGSTVPADSDSVSGWQVLSTSPMTVDLLTLRNGVFTQLAVATVVAGSYTQLRLKLGAGSTVVVDGVTHPLFVPSGLQSGLKIQGPFNVPGGGVADLLLDFDAARSIVLTGSGTYILNPVVRAVQSTNSGSIVGRVLPDTVQTTVFAIQAPDTITSTITASDGRFTLSALTAGTYALSFDPEPGYRDTTITGVAVTSGHVTDVADVQLTPQ
jgi:hypothetical protein